MALRRTFHYIWLDLLLITLTLLAIWGLYNLPPFRASKRQFPVALNVESGLYEGPITLGSPIFDSIVGPHYRECIKVSGIRFLAEPGYPVMVFVAVFHVLPFVLVQIWVADGWDFVHAVLALTKATIVSQLVCQGLKKFIGKMRPNFLDLCQLDNARLAADTQHFKGRLFASVEYCRCRDAAYFGLEAFPSGHPITAFVVGGFLSLYLNAKLKAFSNYHTSLWKFYIVCAPVIGAVLLAATVYIDGNHAVEDIIYSIALAEFITFLAYRAHYASILDYKTNHQYLPFTSTHEINDAAVEAEKSDTDTESRKYRFRITRPTGSVAVVWPRRRQHKRSSGGDVVAPTTPAVGGGIVGAPAVFGVDTVV